MAGVKNSLYTLFIKNTKDDYDNSRHNIDHITQLVASQFID